jgi:hypothetical protein
MSADCDSPWKEALDVYFEAFLALPFPEVHRLIARLRVAGQGVSAGSARGRSQAALRR